MQNVFILMVVIVALLGTVILFLSMQKKKLNERIAELKWEVDVLSSMIRKSVKEEYPCRQINGVPR